MGCLSKCFAVVVALVAVGLGWLNLGGVADGTIPAFHLLQPHGFSSLTDMPDLGGKTALVTGTSSGLGLGVARALARAGSTVLLTARSEAKCAATLKDVRAKAKDPATVSCLILELLDLEQVAKAGDEQAAKLGQLDMLVLNAGIMAPPELLVSKDGFEEQFQVNHLAQFLLLQKLLPALKAAPAPRVVFVSSIAHYFAPAGDAMLKLDTLHDAEKYNPNAWYGWSKLCNILTARELGRREPGIMAHAVHPGGVQGKLLRYSGMDSSVTQTLESMLYWDVDTAANTVLRPLVEEEFGDKAKGNGRYLVPVARERSTTAQAEDQALAASLWDVSASFVAKYNRAPPSEK